MTEHSKISLILEDDPARYPYLINMMFAICYPTMDKLLCCTTANSAIQELIRYPKLNTIMLDHDLDVDINGPNTGLRVCNFIKENKIEFELCIIHTLNLGMIPNMKRILDSCNSGKTIVRPCILTEIGWENLPDNYLAKEIIWHIKDRKGEV